MAQIRIVAPEVVQQGRDENLEQGGASVGGHVVWGEVADKVESEDGLPVSGEQEEEDQGHDDQDSGDDSSDEFAGKTGFFDFV